MAASLNINEILSQVKKLDKVDQITLIQQLASLLKRTEKSTNASVRLTSLAGLGAEIWKGTDIDSYIDGERQW